MRKPVDDDDDDDGILSYGGTADDVGTKAAAWRGEDGLRVLYLERTGTASSLGVGLRVW